MLKDTTKRSERKDDFNVNSNVSAFTREFKASLFILTFNLFGNNYKTKGCKKTT
ncbi:MAG: hypothetical protein ACPLX7_03775 [Candidatus Kapaibacteriota bacterium]|jgi:hypothetical protein